MLPQKILKSGGSEMPFPAFWKLLSLHGHSMWGKVKKKIPASIAILGTGQTTLLTKREGCICTKKRRSNNQKKEKYKSLNKPYGT